jgi:hypothetical protein
MDRRDDGGLGGGDRKRGGLRVAVGRHRGAGAGAGPGAGCGVQLGDIGAVFVDAVPSIGAVHERIDRPRRIVLSE